MNLLIVATVNFREGFANMTRYLVLVDTEHKGVEDGRREVIVVHLVALVRWLRIVAILEQEKEAVR